MTTYLHLRLLWLASFLFFQEDGKVNNFTRIPHFPFCAWKLNYDNSIQRKYTILLKSQYYYNTTHQLLHVSTFIVLIGPKNVAADVLYYNWNFNKIVHILFFLRI
jgi:hypothetical protein